MDRVVPAKRDGEAGDDPCKTRSTPVRLLSNAAHLYRLRVREQPLQELLALIGIAAGVALLFAVQVASSSVTGSLGQLAHAVTGNASLEIAAREPSDMDQRIVARAERFASVRGAAPLIQQRITVTGPAGTAPLTLVGVDERLKRIGGPLVRRFVAEKRDLDALGLYLTASAAKAIGARRGQMLTVESGAKTRQILLAGTLGADEIGGLAESPVALAPLGLAQRLADMPGRINRVLVEPRNGMNATSDLRALAAGRFDVRPSDAEVDLLAEAIKSDNQSGALFSGIAVIIGMLFAYNAMLLAVARRRRQVAYLRMFGADRTTVLATLAFEAFVLGAVASIVGIALGGLLLRVALQSIPAYLAAGFTIGEQHLIEFKTVALSIAGGLAAALFASAKPAIDLFRVDPAEAAREHVPTRRGNGAKLGSRMLLYGLAVVALASVLMIAWPPFTPAGAIVLVVSLVLVIPPALVRLLAGINRVTRSRGNVGFALAVDELAGTPARAAALAVIVAGALTATLGIGGARLDIERGIDRLNHDVFDTSDLWITPDDKSNIFLTRQFDPYPALDRLRQLAGVGSVSVDRSAFLDLGRRRVLLTARATNDPHPVMPSQIVNGRAALAIKRVRAGGWLTLSDSIARAEGYELGDRVTVPTPSGARSFRLAATTANYGWPSGTVTVNIGDFDDAWGAGTATAIGVNLKRGITPAAGKRAVERALGSVPALKVQSPAEARAEIVGSLAQGLARLRQISTLVLTAAMLAIVAAMFAAVWQRRNRLASLRAIGMYRGQLYRTLFSETILIVLLGGLAGLAFGLYCQFFASRWTAVVGGYQSPFEPAIGLGLVTLAEAVALAALATIGPAFLASRIAPRTNEAA